MRASLFASGLLAASLLGADFVAADEADSAAAGSGEYFYGFDEASLKRDIAGVAYLGASQTEEPQVSDTGSGLVFLGGGYVDFWYPASSRPETPGGVLKSTARWTDRIQIGMDWRPDLGMSGSPGPRAAMRYLAGSETDRVGVRADLTALLYDSLDSSRVTAWRVTAMLGSTSVSLTPDPYAGTGAEYDSDGGVLWDVGVGWSSGAISLNAGYLSTYSQTKGLTADMAVLSFGADYAILPGLSLYGELNLVDDPETNGEERLGTVLVVGTGLNF